MDNTTTTKTTSKQQQQPNNNNNKKLTRISTIFRSSCRDRSLSDPVLPTTVKNKPLLPKPPASPKPPTHPFPSICKPKCPIFSQPIITNNPNPKFTMTTHVTKSDPAGQKLSESYSLFYSASSAPVSEKQSMNRKKKKCNHKSSRRIVRKKNVSNWLSSDDDYDDDEEEEDDNDDDESDALLGSRRRRVVGVNRRRRKKTEAKKVEEEMEDSYAVVMCSSDPYMDFRTSMVEMIVEKRMYKADDLERMLNRFLKLNSFRHHPIIIEAFMEIWDALFL